MNPNDPTQPGGYPGPGGYPPPHGTSYQPQAHPPQGRPNQGLPIGYGAPYAPPRRSNKGVVLWSIVGAIVVALGAIGYMLWPESQASIDRRNAELSAERTAVMGDSYLTERYWCDSRGQMIRFVGGMYQTVAFYRNSRADSKISEANYALSGNRVTITAADGRSTAATVERVDDDTMTMTMQGLAPQTLNHCS